MWAQCHAVNIIIFVTVASLQSDKHTLLYGFPTCNIIEIYLVFTKCFKVIESEMARLTWGCLQALSPFPGRPNGKRIWHSEEHCYSLPLSLAAVLLTNLLIHACRTLVHITGAGTLWQVPGAINNVFLAHKNIQIYTLRHFQQSGCTHPGPLVRAVV